MLVTFLFFKKNNTAPSYTCGGRGLREGGKEGRREGGKEGGRGGGEGGRAGGTPLSSWEGLCHIVFADGRPTDKGE